MDIQEIKSTSLVHYLAAHNYSLKKVQGFNYWYLSPLHSEKNASFKVNANENLWFDFSLHKGGNIINLVSFLNPSFTMHQVLKLLESDIRRYGLHNLDYKIDQSPMQTAMRLNYSNEVSEVNTIVTQIRELNNRNLSQYLYDRRIDLSIAQKYCKEVYYQVRGKIYYGIAFDNIQSGMEVRNKYYKRCIGKKSLSYIQLAENQRSSACCVFEGFFDFLTYLTFKRHPINPVCINKEADYIILNSVTTVRQACEILRHYASIHCYLDNDNAGKDTMSFIKSVFPDRVSDESNRYQEYNDLNDFILGRRQM